MNLSSFIEDVYDELQVMTISELTPIAIKRRKELLELIDVMVNKYSTPLVDLELQFIKDMAEIEFSLKWIKDEIKKVKRGEVEC